MKLFTFGCSLTQGYGMKEKVASTLDMDLVNFSVRAGSNSLQVRNLHDYILQNKITHDDIIIWQLTGATRFNCRLRQTEEITRKIDKIQREQFVFPGHHYVMSSDNIFDGHGRFELLSNSPILSEMDYVEKFDVNQELSTVLATLILASKMCKRLLVTLGWSDIFPDEKYKRIFLDTLSRHQISVLDTPYIDWVRENNLPFLDDGKHPTIESGELFAEKVIIPKLKELGWANE